MKRLFLYLTIVALPLLFAGCKKRKTADIKSIMTTEANGAMSPTTTVGSESTLSKDFNKPAETDTKKSITEESESFSEDKSEITYPKLTGSKDDASLNTMISDNAKLGLKSFACPILLTRLHLQTIYCLMMWYLRMLLMHRLPALPNTRKV